MAGPAVYESTLRAPEGPRPGLQPINAQMPDNSGIGKAMSELGASGVALGVAGMAFTAKLQHAQAETQDATIKTDYLTKISGLKDTYANSEDFQNAPGEFAAERKKLEDELSGSVLDNQRRANLKLYF